MSQVQPSRLSSMSRFDPSSMATRPSLLIRIRSGNDSESWDRFADLYCPVIYRVCRRKGLQDADAQEVMQEVLLQIFQYIKSFKYDPDRGKFRSWLHSVVHSRLCRHWQKTGRRPEMTGQEELLSAKASRTILEEELIAEFTSQAIRKIQFDVQPDTWSAFQMTWMEQLPAEVVAEKLGRSTGWVYVAKSRVLRRLAEQLNELI